MKLIKKLAASVIALSCAFSVCLNVSAYDYADAEEDYPVYEDTFVSAAFFSEDSAPSLTAKANSDGVYLEWTFMEGADGYRIYKYYPSAKKYKLIGEYSNQYDTAYYDNDVDSLTTYHYVVRAYREEDGEKIFSRPSEAASVKTELLSKKLSVAAGTSKIRLSWKEDSAADGYEIYCCKQQLTGSETLSMTYSGSSCFFDFGDNSDITFKPLKRTSSTTLSMKKQPGYKYYFRMRSYKVVNGKKLYSEYSDTATSTSSAAMVNGYPKKSKSTVDVVSYRSDINNWTMNISDNDKKIMDDFAKEHFTSDMSPYEKIVYVSEYIYSEVQYVYGDDFNALGNLSPVEAIFVEHKGQCYQYNGAFAEFMAYMGYDVRLIAGFRGTGPNNKWSHYWCEICIDGKYYVMDAGNNKDGLYNVFVPYEFASKYMKDDQVLDTSPTE